MWARLAAVAAGLWLMASPAVLSYGDPAATSDRICGPVGASLAFIAMWDIALGLRWAQLPVATWLVVAPFVLGYPADATASSLVAAAVFGLTAFVGKEAAQRYGGGWRSLRQPLPGRATGP